MYPPPRSGTRVYHPPGFWVRVDPPGGSRHLWILLDSGQIPILLSPSGQLKSFLLDQGDVRDLLVAPGYVHLPPGSRHL